MNKLKRKYVVMCKVKFGIDDTLFCEFSGIEHATQKEARKELNKAIYHPDVLSCSIYEVYRD